MRRPVLAAIAAKSLKKTATGTAPPRLLASDEPTADVSPEGVRHLGGNVAEWTATPADLAGQPDGGRLVRGGTHASHPANARPWARMTLPADARHAALGFRLALDLPR